MSEVGKMTSEIPMNTNVTCNTRMSPESSSTVGKETGGKSAKRQELSLMERIRVIKSREEGKSMRQLAAEFGCGKTQILNILAQKDRYLREWEESEAANNPRQSARKRRPRRTGNEETNRLVWEWYQEQRNKGIHVTGPTIQKQAKGIAESLGITNFAASNGWLDSFRKLHNMGPSKGFSSNFPSSSVVFTTAACVTTINSLLAGLGVTTDTSELLDTYNDPDFFGQASSSSSRNYSPANVVESSAGMQEYDLYNTFYDPLATENPTGPSFYQQQGVSSLNPADMAPCTSTPNVPVPNYGVLRTATGGNIGLPDMGVQYPVHPTPAYDTNTAPEYNHFANLAAAFQTQDYLEETPSSVTERLSLDRSGNYAHANEQNQCINTCAHFIGCGVPGKCPHSRGCPNYHPANEGERSTSPVEEKPRVEQSPQRTENPSMLPPSVEAELPNSVAWARQMGSLYAPSSNDSLSSSIKESSGSSSAQGSLGESATVHPTSPDPYGLRGQGFFPQTSSTRKRRRHRGEEGHTIDNLSGYESFQDTTTGSTDKPVGGNSNNASAISGETGPAFRQVIVPNGNRIPRCFVEILRRIQEEGLIYLTFKDDLDQDWLEVRSREAAYRVPMHGYKTHLARLIVNDVLHYWLEVVGDCVAEGDLVTPATNLNISLIRGVLRALKGGYMACEGKFGVMDKLNGRLVPRLVEQCALENHSYYTSPDHRFRSFDCARWIDVRDGPRCYNCRVEMEGGDNGGTRFTVEEPEDEDDNMYGDTQVPEQHPEQNFQPNHTRNSPTREKQKSPCSSEPLDLSKSVLSGQTTIAGARYEYPPGGVLRYSRQLEELQRQPVEDIPVEEDPEEWVQQQIKRYSFPDNQRFQTPPRGDHQKNGMGFDNAPGAIHHVLTTEEEHELESDFEAIHIKTEFP